MLVGAPLVEAEQDSSICIEDLPEVIMGRKGSRLTEQRLVPFEAARHVAYPYDRPRALHRVRLCGLILFRPTWIQPVIPELAVLFYADRRVRLNLPSPRDRSSQTGESAATRKLTHYAEDARR